MDAPRSHWSILRRWSRGHSAVTPKQLIDLINEASTVGNCTALDTLLDWKTRKGASMSQCDNLRAYAISSVLGHPRVLGRPDLVPWVLERAAAMVGLGAPASALIGAVASDTVSQARVLARVLPRAGELCAMTVDRLMAGGPHPDPWDMRMAMSAGEDLVALAFMHVPHARNPPVVFCCVLAALLLSHVRWRPEHQLASNTALRIKFGDGMSEPEGLAALQALLDQHLDADTATSLVAGFAIIPPEAVRNGLILFAPACASPTHAAAFATLMVVYSSLSTSPPSLSTLLEHEVYRIPSLCEPLIPAGVLQLAMVSLIPELKKGNPGHSEYPVVAPRNVFGGDPVAAAVDQCDACRRALIGEGKTKESFVVDRGWGIEVSVPAFLAGAAKANAAVARIP
ncbi:hypothetical protein BC828DRAFT_383870 [Blastocladiella britannica]|nr:hypothetical protein BC828DRAFT_383870 [Blastocladiella britannica]